MRFILIIIPIFFIGKIIYDLLTFTISNRRRTKKLNEWSDFNKKMLSWGEEIKDESIKGEYLSFCVDKLMNGENRNSQRGIESIMNVDIISIKKEIVRKYVEYIPSLKQEVREEKLNKILK